MNAPVFFPQGSSTRPHFDLVLHGGAISQVVVIDIALQHEAVYLATSDDVPGLVLECETVKEIIDEAVELVPYLWRENKKMEFDAAIEFRIR